MNIAKDFFLLYNNVYGTSHIPEFVSARTLMAIWMLVTVVLTSTYKANLKAQLISPKVNVTFDSLEGLVNQKQMKWSIPSLSPTYMLYKVDEENLTKIGITDYCVFAAMFICTGLIGVYASFKGNKSPEEFLMGNRSFRPLPVAMSLLTSYVSAISFLGITGEIYAHGMQFGVFVLGGVLSIIFTIYFVLPILYPLKLTSINEFIELRFKSKSLRTLVSVCGLLKSVIAMGFLLYAPTIALASVTNIGVLTYIYILGIICTLYSAFGGIRAVIWTDVLQLSVMLIGSALVTVVGCAQIGGIVNVLNISSKGGRLNVFDVNFNPFERSTFSYTFLFGFFSFGVIYWSEQINVQRMCAVKSIEDAKTMLKILIIGWILIYIIIIGEGLVAYATYYGCDPMALGIITRKEEIMTYFISDKMSFIPGLPGLFVATLVGGTLSSLSSVINACVAMLWKDICLRFSYFKNASLKKSMLTNKILCNQNIDDVSPEYICPHLRKFYWKKEKLDEIFEKEMQIMKNNINIHEDEFDQSDKMIENVEKN
ncbi:Sodium/glucose cotransporter [Armadillidium nasatum]|uniref:Sodium/glucose cotransporter n=1 Tax=Armadillidium nasatum TaxID=96803 RepID=A0A5N5TLW7_9CRUS|nr:Sodium/glucose cotransporter [Armadillidium nasatum]